MCALSVTLGTASAAAAATRFASPTGSGTACSAAAPCGIVTAVNNAGASDEVIVAGNQGSYGTPTSPITTQLSDPGSINLHGAGGQPMPVIFSHATNAIVMQFGKVSQLDVEDVNPNSTAVFLGSGGADHLIARANGSGCGADPDGTVADTICDAGNGSAAIGMFFFGSGSGTHTLTLRNVTLIGGDVGLDWNAQGYTQDIDATNAIVRGGSGTDIVTGQTSAGSMATTLDHSNYAHVEANAGTTITAPGFGTNQTAAPVFANAAARDFHQAPSSPTIDHGGDSTLNGATDFEGKPRVFGAHTDIGADEYAPPAVVSESASAVAARSAVLGGSVNTEGGPANAHVEYGLTTAYGSSAAVGTLTLSASPQSVAASVGGLNPSTTYHFRVVVGNGSGTVAGPDQTFTTAAVKASMSALRESNRVFVVGRHSTPKTGVTASRRHKRGTVFSFVLDRAATLKIAIKTRVLGRGVHGRCRRNSRQLRHRPVCLRTVTVFTLTRGAHAGLNKVAFTGRVHGRALKPGHYLAVFTPIDAAGASAPQTLRFTIARR
jgi:hypothetical protein